MPLAVMLSPIMKISQQTHNYTAAIMTEAEREKAHKRCVRRKWKRDVCVNKTTITTKKHTPFYKHKK